MHTNCTLCLSPALKATLLVTIFLFLSSQAWAGGIPDLEFFLSNSTTGNAFVGSTWSYTFRIESNGDSVVAQFPTGSVVLRVDLPPDATYGVAELSSFARILGELDCSVAAATLTCLSVDNFRLLDNLAYANVLLLDVVPQASGPFTVPHGGGDCLVDPDSVVGETNEGNNSCGPDIVEVMEVPPITNSRWMGVTMWDNIVRVYDNSLDAQVNAVERNLVGSTEVHAINDIVVHPMTGLLYVFHRFYESDTHRLGTFDPATGITDIADTGVSFHDSAFDENGTLYGVGRDSVLYTVDLATAVPTALCVTPYGSNNFVHSSLAWDTATDELIQVVSGHINTIDTGSLPANPADACPSSIVDISYDLQGSIWTALYHDGVLFVSNNFGEFFILARNGAFLKLGTLPMPMHGLVPDPGNLPVTAPSCRPDAWVVSIGGYYEHSDLFEVDFQTGSLTWVNTIEWQPNLLDYNPVSDRLVGILGPDLMQWDPCSGQLLSRVEITPSPFLNSIDIGRFGAGHVGDPNSGELYNLNIPAATVSILPGNADPFNAMAIRGDEVIVDVTTFSRTPEGNPMGDTTALHTYSLSNWPMPVGTTPLVYGAGMESVGFREIRALDPLPGSTELLTIVRRVTERFSAQTTTARPVVLATVDASGNVTKIRNLPASASYAVAAPDLLVKDGFEAQP